LTELLSDALQHALLEIPAIRVAIGCRVTHPELVDVDVPGRHCLIGEAPGDRPRHGRLPRTGRAGESQHLHPSDPSDQIRPRTGVRSTASGPSGIAISARTPSS